MEILTGIVLVLNLTIVDNLLSLNSIHKFTSSLSSPNSVSALVYNQSLPFYYSFKQKKRLLHEYVVVVNELKQPLLRIFFNF